jgi:hypothetical protein
VKPRLETYPEGIKASNFVFMLVDQGEIGI